MAQVHDPHEDMTHLTLSIVAKTLFDTDLSGEADVVGESLEVVMNYFMSPMRWFPNLRLFAASVDPAVLPRDQADRRDHLRHYPSGIARAARTQAICSRDCWPRETSRGQAA